MAEKKAPSENADLRAASLRSSQVKRVRELYMAKRNEPGRLPPKEEGR